jgi:uncharacterized repeat protein (TIGR04052 family)
MASVLWRTPGPFAASFALAVMGCGDDTTTTVPEAFALRFEPTFEGRPVTCTTELAGLGPRAADRVGLSDLRFYVSNLRFSSAQGELSSLQLDRNEFQFEDPAGSVSLIDLTSNTEGSCANTAIAQAEGTGRTHETITGTLLGGPVTEVTFDVGVPQALMKETIASNSPEGAPSPLNEMYWNWASGYRHFVMNFTVQDGASGAGGGYIHIGSRSCGPDDGLALEDRDSCDFVNTPRVSLPLTDVATTTIHVDLGRLLAGVDFVAPVYDTATFDVIGEGPGVECHSSPTQPDCTNVFSNLGLDMATGEASPSSNLVFSVDAP